MTALMTRQLPLALTFPEDLRLENFHCAAVNQEVLAALQAPQGSNIYLWGEASTGKTHLLVGAVRLSTGWAPYLDMAEISQTQPEGAPLAWLEGLESAVLVCLDGMDAVAGKADWEEALFHLFNRVQSHGGRLLMAGRQAPQGRAWALPDWGSRAASGLVFRVHPLGDDDLLHLLQKRAAARGLDLPLEVGEFLLTRYRRDMPVLNRLLEILDQAALAAARRLTVPFVKAALAAHQALAQQVPLLGDDAP